MPYSQISLLNSSTLNLSRSNIGARVPTPVKSPRRKRDRFTGPERDGTRNGTKREKAARALSFRFHPAYLLIRWVNSCITLELRCVTPALVSLATYLPTKLDTHSYPPVIRLSLTVSSVPRPCFDSIPSTVSYRERPPNRDPLSSPGHGSISFLEGTQPVAVTTRGTLTAERADEISPDQDRK